MFRETIVKAQMIRSGTKTHISNIQLGLLLNFKTAKESRVNHQESVNFVFKSIKLANYTYEQVIKANHELFDHSLKLADCSISDSFQVTYREDLKKILEGNIRAAEINLEDALQDAKIVQETLQTLTSTVETNLPTYCRKD